MIIDDPIQSAVNEVVEKEVKIAKDSESEYSDDDVQDAPKSELNKNSEPANSEPDIETSEEEEIKPANNFLSELSSKLGKNLKHTG